MKKSLTIILVVLVVLLLVLNVYQFFDKEEKIEEDNSNYLTLVKGYDVKVLNRDAKLIANNEYYAVYNDNGLILYNFSTKQKTEIEIDITNDDDINIKFAFNGFVYKINEEENGFYNFDNQSIKFKNEYESLFPIYDKHGGNTDYLKAIKNNKLYVIDGNSGKVIITEECPNNKYYHKGVEMTWGYSEVHKEQISFVTYTYSMGDTGGGYLEYGYTLYDEAGNLVVKLADDEFYSFNNWNNLVIYKEKK